MADHHAAAFPRHPTPLRLGVFFDGTGNNFCNSLRADDNPAAADTRQGSYANAPSNVALLHQLYPTGLAELPDGALRHCFKLYVEGIGTTRGAQDSLYHQLTGRGSTGVKARVAQAVRAIVEQLLGWRQAYPGGRTVTLEFDLFGFSRGAAAARHLVNDLRLGEKSQLAQALASLAIRCEITIEFVGLFDTVAAIVAPLKGNFSPANGRYSGLRLGLEPGVAKQVVQLVAGDERRYNYPLVRTEHDIVLPGVHSDIGGGYPERSVERVLLSKPQSNRLPLRTPVTQSRAYALAQAQLQCEYSDSPAPRPTIITWEIPAGGGRRELPEKQVYAALQREREVCGHLSRIYLRIMHALAVRSGVPFAELDEARQAWRLPQALHEISRKLHAFALGCTAQPGLTEEEQQLLQGRYIHASAHWNPLKGLRNSILDLTYIDRPAEGGRAVHANR
ncbi:T6SS phospholipase effector Tle1-like catalytic domain-containing protein [Pseudomonas urmiensis]|jgi:hypothetical protein|uniref:T6SS phospholipase effector Tle1-like catalytic domain-containing protein n=1 Tax=Pseudomonas urmiensis TaxID=2745493 RepID=UPI003D0FB21E